MTLSPERSEMIGAWIALHEHGRKISKHDELFWAYENFHQLVNAEPEQAWLCILEIANKASDEHVLANLAAGPLEDLLAQHGQMFIERVEIMARQEPHFRKTLAGVWQNAMPQPLWDRVRKAANIGNTSQ